MLLQPGPYRSEWLVLLQGAIVMSRHGLKLRAMSEFMALHQGLWLLISLKAMSMTGC